MAVISYFMLLYEFIVSAFIQYTASVVKVVILWYVCDKHGHCTSSSYKFPQRNHHSVAKNSPKCSSRCLLSLWIDLAGFVSCLSKTLHIHPSPTLPALAADIYPALVCVAITNKILISDKTIQPCHLTLRTPGGLCTVHYHLLFCSTAHPHIALLPHYTGCLLLFSICIPTLFMS